VVVVGNTKWLIGGHDEGDETTTNPMDDGNATRIRHKMFAHTVNCLFEIKVNMISFCFSSALMLR